MPLWMQIIIGVAATATAIGVIWKKLLKPAAKLINTTDEMLPLLRDLTVVFKNTPGSFAVLGKIAAEFRTDSGSSLRDVVNRLEQTAKMNHENSEILKRGIETLGTGIETLRIGAEAMKQVSTVDRDEIRHLALVLDRLAAKVEAGAATGLRMEEKASGIADDLILATKKVEGVAQDLADSHKRADETHPTLPAGSAADAAAQQTKKEKDSASE